MIANSTFVADRTRALGLARNVEVVRPGVDERPGGRAAIGVEAEYLAEAFRAIEAQHGGTDAYLAQALGVDAELRARLEARLLE